MRRAVTAGVITTATLFLTFIGTSDPLSAASPRAVAYTGTEPNVLVIITDDMRRGTMDAMPIVASEIVDKGLTFRHGIIPTAVCCPSRTSLLTGNASHTTGIYTTRGSLGGWKTFHASGYENNTLATHLDAVGYETALIGKYLNGFAKRAPDGWTPPGWDAWASMAPLAGGDGAYFNYQLEGNLAYPTTTFGTKPEDYSTDVLASISSKFIGSVPVEKPLLLWFAPYGPHGPATPAPRDKGTWPQEPESAIPALNETNMDDKPSWLAGAPKVDAAKQLETLTQQHEALMSVDDAVGNILGALGQTGRLDNTLIVFLSDNGLQLGAHRIEGKDVPYAASAEVPMFLRWDGHVLPGRATSRLTPQYDLTATIAAATRLSEWSMEGKSIFTTDRQGVGMEQTQFSGHPAYCGWRDERYLYIEYTQGEGEEFYDYVQDPNELHNAAYEARYQDEIAAMREKAQRHCSPVPSGFSWDLN